MAKKDKDTGAAAEGTTSDPKQNASLLDDVRAFASQLGFGTGGDGDAAFADFAPSAAKKKIATDKPKPTSKTKDQSKPNPRDSKPANGHSADNNKQTAATKKQTPAPTTTKRSFDTAKPQQQQQQQQQQEQQKEPHQARLKITGRSLLRRDEPSPWWDAAATLPHLPPPPRYTPSDIIIAKQEEADRLLANEEAVFDADLGKGARGGDMKWLEQARRSGTTADKVAAMTVLIQESPIANLRSLDGLISMAGKRGGARAVVGPATDALKELFVTALLPPTRKLRFFEQQNVSGLSTLTSEKEAQRCLMYWAFEDSLKKRYAKFVENLEAASRDNLEFIKDRAVKTSYELLSQRPEQEQRLLSTLVNKLGDPDRKLASKAGYLLTKLLADHPGMKLIVVKEIETFIFRPNLTARARYYAVVYLNQMVLDRKADAQGGSTLARKLIDLYFTMFKMVLDGKIGTAAELAKAATEKAQKQAQDRAKQRGKKKVREVQEKQGVHSGEMDARMLSALITGVRRAFPFVGADDVEPLVEAHADALFRLIHTRSLGVATQALLLLFQLMTNRNSVSDRFYRALYAVVLSPELPHSTKAPMFLSLLFKALKADISNKRCAAFAKRLLQVAQEAPPGLACGCLFLVSELFKMRPALWNSVLQPEDKEEDVLERFKDAPKIVSGDGIVDGFGGVDKKKESEKDAAVVESTDDDEEDEEVVESEDEEDSEMEIGMNSSSSNEEDSEDEELPSKHNQKQKQKQKEKQNNQLALLEPASLNPKNPKTPNNSVAFHGWPTKDSYDMRAREPQFCNADRSCMWELITLASHVHPSVAAMARTLLAGANITYDGDPIRDFTLATFLDKFLQRKPKAATKGDSFMQPLRSAPVVGVLDAAGTAADAFAVIAAKDVAPDDMFFHKYYSLSAVQSKRAAMKAKKKKKGEDEDEELVSGSEYDSEEDGAIDDFLAGEEEGGDEGLGADPDRSLPYDYTNLAAAMIDSDDESEDRSDGEAGEEESEEDGGIGSGSEAGSDVSLDGAEFSDMSGSEEEEESDSDVDGAEFKSAKSHWSDVEDLSSPEKTPKEKKRLEKQAQPSSSGSEEEEEEDSGSDLDLDLSDLEEDADLDLEGGSGSDDDEDDEDEEQESDIEFDSLSDLTDASDAEDGSDEEDDAAADAEVAALMAALQSKKNKGSVAKKQQGVKKGLVQEESEEDEEMLDLNPFELAQASSSDNEDDDQTRSQKKGGKKGGMAVVGGFINSTDGTGKESRGGKKRKNGGGDVFASAEDYEAMIAQDEEEERKKKGGSTSNSGQMNTGGAARGVRRGKRSRR